MKTLWIVGQAFNCEHCSPAVVRSRCWEFQGVFDSEEKAVAACKETNFFVAPQILNQEVPTESIPMPGAYFPHAQA